MMSHRWLAALLAVFLVVGLTGILFTEGSLAQTPAGSEVAAQAVSPACDAKVLERCSPNSGDTAWMLTSVALVLMMTIPGLGLFYGGMVRRKNVARSEERRVGKECRSRWS